MPFALFCALQIERVKARLRDVYQDGLRLRWVAEERHRREQRKCEALRAWKAAW